MPSLNPPTPTLLRSLSTVSRPIRCLSTATTAAAAAASSTTTTKPPLNPFRNRLPPYPYGPSQHYKASNHGLYGASTVQFGNIITGKKGPLTHPSKTRRMWHPNIHRKRLWSAALGKYIRVKVQARVLRTIDKVGGLDEYLLGDKPGRVRELGVEGWRLRWRVLRSGKVRDARMEERMALGVPVDGVGPAVAMVEDEGGKGSVEIVGGGEKEGEDVDEAESEEGWEELGDTAAEKQTQEETPDERLVRISEKQGNQHTPMDVSHRPADGVSKEPDGEQDLSTEEGIRRFMAENDLPDTVQTKPSLARRALTGLRRMFSR